MTRLRTRGAAPQEATAATRAMTGAVGREGFAKSKQAQAEAAERRARGYTPFRFYLKKGEQKEIIVLTDKLDDAFFMWEHSVAGVGNNYKDSEHVPCVKEDEICAICALADASRGENPRFKSSYYAMFLTIYDPTPYVDKNDVGHPGSRRILSVKANGLGPYQRILEIAEAKHGTIRGMSMLVARDESNTSTNTGTPVPDEEGLMYQMLSEEDLDADFGHDAVVGDDGKVVKEENADLEPLVFDTLFPRPDQRTLQMKYGGSPTPGSRAQMNDEWDTGSADSVPASTRRRRGAAAPAPEAPAAPVRTTRPARTAAAAPAAQETASPRRRARPEAAALAPEAQEDTEVPFDEEKAAPPPPPARSRARVPLTAAAPASAPAPAPAARTLPRVRPRATAQV